MSKLKITIEGKEKQVKTCKHEVGGVYTAKGRYWLLIEINDIFAFVDLSDFETSYYADRGYKSLEAIDANNTHDIPVDAELIIRDEVQS